MEVKLEQSGEPAKPSPAGSRKTTILIADDDAEVRALFCASLPREYHVVQVSNGLDAVRVAEEILPDLIVCDSQMPGLHASEVMVLLRKIAATAGIPVIISSGYLEADVVGSGPKPTAFLQKPFAIGEFQQLVRQTLASHPRPV
jgi:CheY-like chemotaxis protein